MTSRFTNCDMVNYMTLDELEHEYQEAIKAHRRAVIRDWMAGIITFAIIGAVVYFS